MVRLSELDDFVNLAFDPVPADEPEGLYWSAFGHLEVIETVVVKGHGHEDELAENSHDIRDLDPDDPEYDGKLAALRTERKRLQALPMVPDVVEERPTGITVAKLWRSLNTQERRDYLVRAGVKVIVAGKRGPEHGLAPYWLTGDPHKVMGTVTGQH
jgi:hypothetical protein